MQHSRRAILTAALFVLSICFVPALAGAEPFKCSICHHDLTSGSVTHKPVAAGQCLRCHKQLSDNHPLGQGSMGFIVQKDKLCVTCHTTLLTKPHLHKPVAQGLCYACHMPHSSENKALLKDPVPTLCFRSHPKEHFTGIHTHKPVAQGNCLACHDPKLVTEVSTEKATNFRNGDRNLHSVHVNKAGKGRSCKICHNPHASAQDRLINPKAPGFGSWEIPIHFQATPTGGGCSVGCHKTFHYDRVKAVVQ